MAFKDSVMSLACKKSDWGKRLVDSSISKRNNYNAAAAKADADFIDENFHPFVRDSIRSEVNCDPRFCPKEFRDAILDMIVYHFHLHPMIHSEPGYNEVVRPNLFLRYIQVFVISGQEILLDKVLGHRKNFVIVEIRFIQVHCVYKSGIYIATQIIYNIIIIILLFYFIFDISNFCSKKLITTSCSDLEFNG